MIFFIFFIFFNDIIFVLSITLWVEFYFQLDEHRYRWLSSEYIFVHRVLRRHPYLFSRPNIFRGTRRNAVDQGQGRARIAVIFQALARG